MAEQTRREALIELLEMRPWSPRELAAESSIRIRNLEDELRHVRKTVGKRFEVEDPVCARCDFVFRRRKRLTTPSRCPECRNERIDGPWFSITRA